MAFIRAEKQNIQCGEHPILLRGFGLGGWFLPEGYMWKLYTKCDRPRRMEAMIEELCGTDYATYFWNTYFNHYITEKDIELIAKEGFNSVRLPLNARHLYRIQDGKFEFVKSTIERVDALISWCKRQHIYVILDMHAAPGGQTGQNIDDSEDDTPQLFTNKVYEQELVTLWSEIAKRYRDEETVAGYDLLNEPLPNWFNKLYGEVLPLYRKLIDVIRLVDNNHMIILEGVHWATDFSIFDDFMQEEADNIMLQFHKYWNNPDAESLQPFLESARRLQVPLYMGEGGENNCEWYTMLFPMLERQDISWSFWSYKKMDCLNSPVSFEIPKGWNHLNDWIDGKREIREEEAKSIFNDFLWCITNIKINHQVFHALKRQVPVTIPCEAYDINNINSKRVEGAELRKADAVTLIFETGKRGMVDYKRYGGEPQPKEENVLLKLWEEDSVSFQFVHSEPSVSIELDACGRGILEAKIGTEIYCCDIEGKKNVSCRLKCQDELNNMQFLTLKCKEGFVQLDMLRLKE